MDNRLQATHVCHARRRDCRRPVLGLIIASVVPLVSLAQPLDEADRRIDTMVVTPTRSAQPAAELAGSASALSREDIELVGHQHLAELGTRIPGVWISRGSGQEHLTAIRSPVLTGAGACGAFLFLEDGIPVRPAGFCNVNQLFEINTEQAASVEVLRGPAGTLYGSNGLHGTINVLSISDNPEPGWRLGLAGGSHDYYRARLDGWHAGQRHGFGVSTHLLSHSGFQRDAGHHQYKLNAHWVPQTTRGGLRISAAATGLDQDTAGYILGRDAYRDREIRRSNPNPEAFREATAQRLYAVWERDLAAGRRLDVRPFLRRSRMDFLQHFLPGQPLEENSQVSAGWVSTLTWERPGGGAWLGGIDVEWASGDLRQTQAEPLTTGSAFLQATRPQGRHYDYDVDSLMAAAHANYRHPLGSDWFFEAGARLEWIGYDYTNNMLSGNTREDGSACGFGGCLYNRPGDRRDNFTNLAPRLAVGWRGHPDWFAWMSVSRGFRVPQATELYRLQNGQQVADLASERLDNIELGLRGHVDTVRVDVTTFAANKRNFIFRDTEGFNVSDGRTRHVGVEYALQWAFHRAAWLEFSGTYARHGFRFDRLDGPGEVIPSGNDIDGAPRRLFSTRVGWATTARSELELEWAHQGGYFVDSANANRHGSHDLWHLRARWGLPSGWQINAQIYNLADRLTADRADYAFGNFRYFPGARREFRLELVSTLR